MKILSEQQLRERFTKYPEFRFRNSALVRQYSARGSSSHKDAMAQALTDVLADCMPVFALVDPGDARQDTSKSDLLRFWRLQHMEMRPIDEAPYHVFEKPDLALRFLISVSLQSAWRTCIWSMDASTSILMSDREYFHVNCSRSDLLRQLDEKWKEISMMVTA